MSDLFSKLQVYKTSPVAVYGLGVETRKVLPELKRQFQIVGLLDGYRESGELYGEPIISMSQAVEHKVKLILVIARPGSCRVIAKRIGDLCMKHGIALIDIRGRDLCDLQKVTYDFRGTEGMTKSCLMKLAEDSEVVSFDLFDTLAMRQVLFSSDVFELVDRKLKEQGILIRDFCGKRLESEKYLAGITAPTLTEIYRHMADTDSAWDISPEMLANLEWDIDYHLLVPRQEMCELLIELNKKGKEVYIVSDTYYSKDQLVKILQKCGVSCYRDIIASCEYRTGKTQRLFEQLKNRISGKKSIHIGDDSVADVEYARRNGINTCQIYSGGDLLGMAGYLGMWDYIDSLSNRIKVGMFIAKLFNSPFQFESDERKISIKDAYDIGYLIFAPIITDYVIWLERQIQEKNIGNIWFCARDGYLIKKLYDEMKEDDSSTYFLTSRTAAIRAGVENEEDIRYVGDMKFSGSLGEQMWERFGISVSEIQEGDSLLDYSREILEKTGQNRNNYRSYIEKLPLKKGDIAFFDFVAKGTSQMFIQRLVDRHLIGFYFLQLEQGYMKRKNLEILPFYKEEEAENSAIFENYYILETVLTSPMPSVVEFDEAGQACYGQETRKEEDILCIRKVQKGIYDYFRTYLELCRGREDCIDKKIDEVFLLLIHHVSIFNQEFLNLKEEDPFFNRFVKVCDLI